MERPPLSLHEIHIDQGLTSVFSVACDLLSSEFSQESLSSVSPASGKVCSAYLERRHAFYDMNDCSLPRAGTSLANTKCSHRPDTGVFPDESHKFYADGFCYFSQNVKAF